MKLLLSRLLVALFWCLHWLPLPLLRALGWGLGRLLYAVGRERRQVALTNLALCFPHLDETARRALARRHFVAFGRAFLDRSLGWWASEKRLRRLIHLKGEEHLQACAGQPVIILAPHFVGLDAGGTMMTLTTPLVSVYSNQKNPVFNRLLLQGRQRFNQPTLLSRQDGMRKAVRCLRQGLPFYYLPDMDFGREDSIFVPFFGVQAATITGVSRLARLTGARVIPCITKQLARGYDVELLPPWADFPGESVEADTLFMNQFIESQVLTMPEQYFWVHKRFKTRPAGEQRIYP